MLAGIATALILTAGFGYWAMEAVDRDAMDRQVQFVRAGLADISQRLPVEQESATIWDDAVLRTRAGDGAWMADNLGVWMGTYFGHDADYVLDQRDQPIYAMEGDETRPAALFEGHRATLAPYLAKLRQQMAALTAEGTPAVEALVEAGVLDTMLFDKHLAVVSLKPIIPSSTAVELLPGEEYVHVAVQRIDQSTLAEVAEQYDIAGIELLASDQAADASQSVPVSSETGRILGIVSWQGDRPGRRMLAQVAPGVVSANLVGILLLAWLVRRLGRSATQLRASEAQTQFLAFHDVLTSLPNRALFDDRVERAMAGARRSGSKVALHSLDIDRFKSVNDTLGHQIGDELIRQVGARISAELRETDTVARLGGDEFAVIQTDVASDVDAEELARRLVQALANPFDLSGEQVFVSASVGVMLCNGEESDRSELLRKADIALYEAKARGRNRFEMFVGDMDEMVKRRRLIEHELRHAIDTGTQLAVVYQPLYAADGKAMRGAEALVRWNHPVHGLLSPELFIGIAEERGLIEPLGEWVLEQACRFAVEAGLPFVAVNVSPVQFRNKDLAQRVASTLERTGLAPQRLQLEITEGVLMDATGVVNATLADLRETGVRIALDDFGTGYSSMSYLRQYAVDKLKIDRSFVAQLGTSEDADSIVRAMVSLARSLRLTVTAEGVETAEQRDHLAAIGCQELQGFLMSRPIPAERLLALLGRPTSQRTVA